MKEPDVVWKFTAFSVKPYIPFLKDACVFVISFNISGVLPGSYDKENCTFDQLKNGCVQMGLCMLVNVKQ